MSKERLNCEDICSNYYSSWEEGTCMECCEIYNRGECPVVYVNDLERQIADLEAKLAESKEQLNNSEQKCLICNKYQENDQLKKQLEEKEKIEFTDTINFVETSEPDRVAEYIDELLEKLAQAQKTIEIQNKLTDALIEENLDYSYDLTDIAHERAEELAESWEEDYKQEIEKLKQQLAEKEEEIKKLNNIILLSQLQAPKEQILNILGSQCVQYNPDQDKISFALEQLEKVKELVEEKGEISSPFGTLKIFASDVDTIINQLITELKEGK